MTLISRIRWEAGPTYTRPIWVVNPDIRVIDIISRSYLFPDGGPLVELTVSFLAEGAFNKTYTVTTTTGSIVKLYIFRATLPIEPSDKTRSEVATLDYIKGHTSIPVPAVIAHESSSENELGFEWILMEKIPGVQLRKIWADLSDASKEGITREIATHVVQMREKGAFDRIGGLYYNEDAGFIIGPIVTQSMFMGGRRQFLSRDRGPYHHDSEFVNALIDTQVADIHFLETMSSDDPNYDEDLLEDGPDIIHAMDELRSLIPLIFPRKANVPLRTVLLHPDLSLNNIMIDPTTLNITGIIDWECLAASPQWEDTYPQFLTGPEVEEEPSRVGPGDTDELRNEMWDNWEKMQLRKVFDEVAGHREEEPLAELKRAFLYYIDVAEYSQVMVERWVKETREKLEAPSDQL